MTNDAEDQPGLGREHWRSTDQSPEALARRTRALELAINYHVDTTIHNAEYLRELRTMPEKVKLRYTHHRYVVETANAFDLFLMGQGPLVLEFAVRLSEKPPPAEVAEGVDPPTTETPTETHDDRQDPDPG